MRQCLVDALASFRSNGKFTLEDMSLSVEELQELQHHFIRYRFRYPLSEGSLLQFSWKQVTLEAPEARVGHRYPQGSVTEEEPPPSLRTRFEETKVLGGRWVEGEELFPQVLLSVGERYLLGLLDQLLWKRISLEGIWVMEEGARRPLGGQFLEGLGEIFSRNLRQIKELSLKGVNLQASGGRWVSCLNQARQLEVLRLEEVDQGGLFLSEQLCQELSRHPTLLELDLGRSRLEQELPYQLLRELFNKNYRIHCLVLAEPELLELKCIHKQLMNRVKQPSWQRFQQEQLTPEHKAELVTAMMRSNEPLYTQLLVGERGRIIAQEVAEEEEMPRELFQCLPKVFREHPEHLLKSWPLFFVGLEATLPAGATLGYHLLEEAYALKRPDYMVVLLKAGADLLEEPQEGNQRSLFNRLLLDQATPIWSGLLKEHLQKDLAVFMPSLFQFLEPYQAVSQGLEEVKKQLNGLLANLLEQLDVPFFLRLFRIGFKSKQSIYETDLRLLLRVCREGVKQQVSTSRDWPLIETLSGGLQWLLGCVQVQGAKGGLFNRIHYHKGMSEKLQKLLDVVDKSKRPAYENDFTKEYGKMNETLAEQRRQLEATFAQDKAEQKAGQASQLTAFEVRLAESDAARAREKAESDAARAREKAEFEAKLAESDAVRARERAEFEAKLAESDAARAREKAESDAARAREKAELEAKLVENNVARVRDREELETKLVDFSEFFLMKLKENQGRGVPPTLGEGAVGTQPAFFKVSSATERVASKELGSERELRQCGNSWEKR